jgi:8-oxo-dGTP pyrophosphatase MutT (NUDIX family)
VTPRPAADRVEVRAAGGLVVRERGDGPEFAVVHRPRYDDWTFPKGKCDRGESFEDAARREVAEETGLHCELGAEVGTTRYVDNRGRPKVVRYWLMPAPPDADAAVAGAIPNPEVDELRWLAPAEAAKLLSYAHDRDLLGGLPGAGPGIRGPRARPEGSER